MVESEIYRIPIGRHKTHYKEQEGDELEALNKVYQNGSRGTTKILESHAGLSGLPTSLWVGGFGIPK